MGFAFGLLRVAPAQFWSMTPRELAAAMRPYMPAMVAPRRAELDTLMAAFPDRRGDPNHG